MSKRTLYSLLVVLLLVSALAVVLYLRQKAPPEAARLLPESDAIVYVDLKPLRLATHFEATPVARSTSYQQFIDATGVVAERDLDDAAFAIHRMADPKGPNGVVAFSEVINGRFDTAKMTRYLHSLATNEESYAGHTIYSIPSENRTLRVTEVDYDTIAASNMPTPEQIHSMLDRSRAAASPFAGSSLLAARYQEVPAFSSAWAVGQIALPFSEDNRITVLGLGLPLPADTTFVASLRFRGALQLRIDQIAPTELAADKSVQSITGLLALFRTMQLAQPPPRTPEEVALRAFADSIKVEQNKDRATLTAVLPLETLKHLTTP